MKRIIGTVTVLAIAVFVVSGGAASAAKLITGKDIKNGSIRTADLSSSAKRALKGNTGARGAQGPQGIPGPQGAPGPQGSSGLAGVQTVDSPWITIPPGGSGDVDANCPAGKTVIGTGFFDTVGDTGFVKSYTFFVGGVFHNDTGISIDVHVQAICATTSGGLAVLASNRRAQARKRFSRDVTKYKTKLRAAK